VSAKAVVLLSGGIDSSTTLAIARDKNYDLYALSFRYGQKNRLEVPAAEKIARALDVKEHLVLNIDLAAIGGSALTADIPVPRDRTVGEIAGGIPVTYVPARNIVFLSYALSWAESLGASDIFIGVNSVDYSGYPDCRPEFIEAFQRMANMGTKAGAEGRPFTIHTPLIRMTKSQIIQKGVVLGVDYGLTQSCYDPSPRGTACGVCDSCVLRKKGFHQAGITDPIAYDA